MSCLAIVSWQSFSPDCGKVLIPGLVCISVLRFPCMEWRLYEIKPCLRMNVSHCYIASARSPAHQFVVLLLFFPWFYWRCFSWDFCLLLSVTPLSPGLHQEKALLSSTSVKVPGGIFEVFTVKLWPEAGRTKCETRNVWTLISALGEILLVESVHAIDSLVWFKKVEFLWDGFGGGALGKLQECYKMSMD